MSHTHLYHLHDWFRSGVLPFDLVLPALCFVLLVACWRWCVLDVRKPAHFPPGPKWYPVVGSFIEYGRRRALVGYHHLVWKSLAQEHGSPLVGLKMGKDLVVGACGEEAVREVLTREEFNGRPDGFFFRSRTFGKRLGIVFSDGQLWQRQRKFSFHHLRNFGYGRREMENFVADEVCEFVESLKKISSADSTGIEMHTIFDVSVLNVLWTMLAGRRFDLDNDVLREIFESIHRLFRIFDISGGLLNQLPALRHLLPNVSGYSDFINNHNKLYGFLKTTIREHKETFCESSPPRDLIDCFLAKMYKQNDDFSDQQLLSVCLDMLLAGSETTSNTLGFSMLYMLKYPNVQKLVGEELDTVVGSNRFPTMQDKTNLPYTEATLLEILRIHTVAPLGIAHRVTKDTQLLGYVIPKDTIVLTNLHSVHTDASIWHEPEIFKPERFLNEKGQIQYPPEFNFLPFGYGKRSCLGKSLAQTNLFLFFATILHQFRLVKEGPEVELSEKGYDGVTMSPKPYKAILIPRH